jgi:K+-sensing histidine kinase KdpD
MSSEANPTQLKTPRLHTKHSLIASLAVAVASVALATALSIPIKDLMPYSRGLLLFVAIIFSAWYGGMWPGIVASLLAAKAFSYFLIGQRGFDFSLDAALRFAIFMSAAFVVTYLTVQRNQTLDRMYVVNAELEKALDEIRALRGILPICMHCKQIRNDAGLWQQVDRYISEHSDAKFSHGVCPDCISKFYPESAKRDDSFQ